MAAQWFVIQTESADNGTVKLLPSSAAAQDYITTRIASGVPPEQLRLFNADDTPFGVAYQPIVTIGTAGPKAPIPGSAVAAAPSKGAPAANGAATAAASDGTASEPAGTQDGVRLSSMFKTD